MLYLGNQKDKALIKGFVYKVYANILKVKKIPYA